MFIPEKPTIFNETHSNRAVKIFRGAVRAFAEQSLSGKKKGPRERGPFT
jgi:hypothetical protein